MKQNIFSAIRLTAVLILLCVVFYSTLVLAIAKVMPDHGKGQVIADKMNKEYYANIGQKFDDPRYFNSRPSAAAYNPSGSCGSNKGPSNPDYLKEVQETVNAAKANNPGMVIPVDMVTASGSGLDPDISLANARAQIYRIAKLRKINKDIVEDIVNKIREKPLLGPEKINVLKLNIALDQIK